MMTQGNDVIYGICGVTWLCGFLSSIKPVQGPPKGYKSIAVRFVDVMLVLSEESLTRCSLEHDWVCSS